MSTYPPLIILLRSVPEFGNGDLIRTENSTHRCTVQAIATAMTHLVIVGLITYLQWPSSDTQKLTPFVTFTLIAVAAITIIRDGIKLYYARTYINCLRSEMSWRRLNRHEMALVDYFKAVGEGIGVGFMASVIVNFV